MNKAVLISIQPKWCQMIASGKKTIEVRKTVPTLQTPFKCYIYCTAQEKYRFYKDGLCVNGRVIGEFVCDYIYNCDVDSAGLFENETLKRLPECCLNYEEIVSYSKGVLPIYGLHISNLLIYDTPKGIRNFWSWKTEHQIVKAYYQEGACDIVEHARVLKPIERPPQSWCYVEDT